MAIIYSKYACLGLPVNCIWDFDLRLFSDGRVEDVEVQLFKLLQEVIGLDRQQEGTVAMLRKTFLLVAPTNLQVFLSIRGYF